MKSWYMSINEIWRTWRVARSPAQWQRAENTHTFDWHRNIFETFHNNGKSNTESNRRTAFEMASSIIDHLWKYQNISSVIIDPATHWTRAAFEVTWSYNLSWSYLPAGIGCTFLLFVFQKVRKPRDALNARRARVFLISKGFLPAICLSRNAARCTRFEGRQFGWSWMALASK